MTTDPLLLLLADGRFPSGAHAHSFGLEASVNAGLLAGVEDLSAWAVGCMHTTWLVDATAAVRAARLGEDVAQWVALDDEVQARLLSSHARTVSRTLGRQMLRTGRAIWPHVALRAAAAVHRDGPSAPLGLGAVIRAAGLPEVHAAELSMHHAVQSAATAAVRLLGLDPFAVTRLVARMGPDITTTSARAVELADAELADADVGALPSAGAPMVDLLLTHHHHADGRLFAS